MSKFITFFSKHNRYRNLIVGLLIGLAAFSFLSGIYAAAVAATCFNLKDVDEKKPWRWDSWLFTLAGGLLGSLLWLII